MADLIEDVFLEVNGRRYSGWKSIRVTRSIETLCGSFALEVTERWGEDEPWPVEEGDACRVLIGAQVVIDGYIDAIDISASKDARTVTYTGRDRAADLVDCSLLVADTSTKGNKWTYRNLDIAQFGAAIAAQHRVKVSVQKHLILKKDPSLVAHPGETGYEALKRAAGSAGVLLVSDGAGGLVITRTGSERAARLVEGVNILDGQVKFDASERFHLYVVTSQPPGSDEASGEALRVQASATDADVRRTNRVMVIRPDKGLTKAEARQRADWEARTRAGRASSPAISVQGWEQPSGLLWQVNAISRVVAPRMLRIDGDLVISQVEFSIGEGGRTTQMKLARPDAFLPEPQKATAVVSGEGAWKEQIEKGKF